jgi:nucleotide-binding universal stress UspA family protein
LHSAGRLYAIYVVPPIPTVHSQIEAGNFDVVSYQKELTEYYSRELREMVSKKASNILGAEIIVKQGDAATQIVRAAEENDMDIIVISTHGQTGWRRYIFGSVAEKVVRYAECPVLVVQASHDGHESEKTS